MSRQSWSAKFLARRSGQHPWPQDLKKRLPSLMHFMHPSASPVCCHVAWNNHLSQKDPQGCSDTRKVQGLLIISQCAGSAFKCNMQMLCMADNAVMCIAKYTTYAPVHAGASSVYNTIRNTNLQLQAGPCVACFRNLILLGAEAKGSECCSAPVGLDPTKLSPKQWKTQAVMMHCTSAASCGDVSQLRMLLEPMAEDPSFLDSCLDSLIVEAVTGGHVEILEHLATCKPPGWTHHLNTTRDMYEVWEGFAH